MTAKVKANAVRYLLAIRERAELNGIPPHYAQTMMLIAAEELAARAAHRDPEGATALVEDIIRTIRREERSAAA